MMEIPEGVTVQLEEHKLTAKGPQGEVQIVISKQARVKIEGKTINILASKKALQNTVESLVKNMLTGVSIGYKQDLKVLYAHFPVSLEVRGKDIFIKNFLGEKQPRHTNVIGQTKLQIKGQAVTVSGPDKEAVGQTIANLKIAMRIKEKDARVFQDGIYEIES